MLVFQSDVEHVMLRARERGGLNAQSLLCAIATINLYLPQDWRMTRTRNQFRIAVAMPNNRCDLVGSSYRLPDDTILHIVDTVIGPGFDDNERSAGESQTAIADSRRPNLYYFEPCPDDCDSPLFARQYEKIRKGKGGQFEGTEYHRVHPLHPWGMDAEHFRWVKWDIGGQVQLVDFSDEGYHGLDYWKVPALGPSEGRGSVKAHLDRYHRVFKEHGVALPAPPESPSTPYEPEFKYRYHGTQAGVKEVFAQIEQMITDVGLEVVHRSGRTRQVDRYLDDADLSLFRHGVSLRVRKATKSARLTLKARWPRSIDVREYRRMEEEVSITRGQESALETGERIPCWPLRLATYLVPGCGMLRPVAEVVTDRILLTVRDAEQRRAEVCMDRAYYRLPGETRSSAGDPEVELELESKGMPRVELASLAALIGEIKEFSFAAESKYERAVTCLDLSGSQSDSRLDGDTGGSP